jgi:hypothetical protein
MAPFAFSLKWWYPMKKKKGISEPMLCFGNNMFLKSNENAQRIGRIGIQ